jgi:hypothetical protein
MILYLKDPTNSTKTLLGLINTFSKVAAYKTKVPIMNMLRKKSRKQSHSQ